ncbi:uncharacterized protein LOC106083601 [Stomoxys calcitrans]|uniref:uncharacterized protein LOC106083601 n=1 Tax=Stomoxys calcitrans TaxID=35570 RepID=UPI0027E24214|nr:uncharacterized protein LOC106083601 [Stomoxys calcitrans]
MMEIDSIFDIKSLLCDQEEPILTEIVRNHYINYLEKQLMENLISCFHGKADKDCPHDANEKYKGSIKHIAKLLEDKAVEACQIAQRYQRAMVKIIATVRRSTQENRLISPLENAILKTETLGMQNKETQTEAGLLEKEVRRSNEMIRKSLQQENNKEEEEDHEMTLDEKIEIFQKRLINGNIVASPYSKSEHKTIASKRHHSHVKKTHDRHHQSRRNHHRPYKEKKHSISNEVEVAVSPISTVITPIKSTMQTKVNVSKNPLDDLVADMENSNDSVALELARLFSEEKTELDEIFGIDPNQEPDDPHICKILKEIEEAHVSHEPHSQLAANNNKMVVASDLNNKILTPKIVTKSSMPKSMTTKTTSVDLSNSLWPCELFMQKRKLSDSLARLIEEDLRWHDIMKWKFKELFGEDSDDEFAPCSPSIEMDDILMGSCVKRISPWIVKHLMKPMKHGLIGNRFIFKKLAKHIARSIIMENQYPDESIIKECVENYFCLHQAVMHLDDLQDVPSISLY